MTKDEVLSRISSNPDILHGKPCIKGTRIAVYMIVGMIADGEPTESILENFPSLTAEDIHAAVKYASMLCEYEAYAV